MKFENWENSISFTFKLLNISIFWKKISIGIELNNISRKRAWLIIVHKNKTAPGWFRPLKSPSKNQTKLSQIRNLYRKSITDQFPCLYLLSVQDIHYDFQVNSYQHFCKVTKLFTDVWILYSVAHFKSLNVEESVNVLLRWWINSRILVHMLCGILHYYVRFSQFVKLIAILQRVSLF